MFEALERESRQVEVLAVVAVVLFEPDESLRELERFESWDVFLVISHDVCRRRGSKSRKGTPQ
jgi:hypothetical protein